ncbi:hypothetical protein E6P78_29710 [Streptomyces sp. A0958]|uniref:hypothetical protein n=1 Tax=Streptomyces sp. A0958 TaxID=2563101 RepID=UPI00109EC80A|nr:hypothetical protein [Streptomyces sp. A0958]THA59018.1 hypothetical protein E6P78_29710 [Streptomyces sp. A0958]
MSTLVAPVAPRTTPSGPTLRAGARVVVLRHRRALWIAGALALVWIGTLVGFTLWADHVGDAFAADPCTAQSADHACNERLREFSDSMHLFSTVLKNAGLALTVLPALVAAFVAGPMIAREFESGTYKLSWTQSVSPARWLLAELAVPAALLVAGVSVLSAVFAWARAQAGEEYPVGQFEHTAFGAMGTAPVAYALLGLALGALAGLLTRRTVPAMSAAVLATAAVGVTLNRVRSGLWPLSTQTSTGTSYVPQVPDDAWISETGRITGDGTRLPFGTCWEAGPEVDRCLAGHGVTGYYIDYHPVSHFWPLQLVETGILLVLAAAAVALAFRVLRRRHG